MRSVFFIAIVFVFFAACGKNDGVYPAGSLGYSPYGPGGPVQAPPPPAGSFAPPVGGTYPPYAFNPQMPPGYPPQYTPFLPIDNYYNSNPQLQPMWPQIWSGWLSYAGNQGYGPYDIGPFYTQYFPQVGNASQFGSFYNNWVTPQTTCSSCSTDPSTFWAAYIGYSFSSCDSCSY